MIDTFGNGSVDAFGDNRKKLKQTRGANGQFESKINEAGEVWIGDMEEQHFPIV